MLPGEKATLLIEPEMAGSSATVIIASIQTLLASGTCSH